jgi:protein-S-isoprenylcysteine O-methyltransferase Ste14
MTISFWLILLAALVYGLLHSFLASLAVKRWARQWLGPAFDRWYRLAFNFFATLTLFPILILLIVMPDKRIYSIPYPWVMITLMIQLIAAGVLLISLRQTGIAPFLGLRQTSLEEDSSPPHLVTDGLYRYVRHPLYSAGLVIIWLTPVLTWNLLGLIVGLTVYIFIGAYFEERKLLGEFGKSYVEYRRRTPMLLPGIHHKRDAAQPVD